MRRCILSLAVVALMASSSMGTYLVQQAAWAPTGPDDSIWGYANQMSWGINTDGGSGSYPPSSVCSGDARFLWDGTYLYARVAVTDQQHTCPSPGSWQYDGVELYVNAINKTTSGFSAGTTQDVLGISSTDNSSLFWGTQIGSSVANNNVIYVRDANFDYTGTNGSMNGNYVIQIQYAWTGANGSGGLALAAAPTAGALMRLGGGAVDADGGTRIQHISTSNYDGSGNGYINAWNNPSTWGAAQLDTTVAPEPATLSLLALGGLALLKRRKA